MTVYQELRQRYGHAEVSLAARLASHAHTRFAVAFPCDKCGAQPWMPCKTKNGNRAQYPHQDRENKSRALLLAAAKEMK